MTYNFKWYNLPTEIKKAIEPYKNDLSKEAKNITWFNLPNKLNKLYDELSEINPNCAIPFNKYIWFNLPKKLSSLCSILNCAVARTEFYISSPITCESFGNCNILAYHNGAQPLPILGDMIYSDDLDNQTLNNIFVAMSITSQNEVISKLKTNQEGVSIAFDCL